MTTNIRRILAATGAAALLTGLGAFATMQPASAMPADPSVSTLPAPADACAALDSGQYHETPVGDWGCRYRFDESQDSQREALHYACYGKFFELNSSTPNYVLAECVFP